MWYVIIGNDHENSLSNRLQVRDQHLVRLNTLKSQGRLLVAGPCPLIDSEDPGDSGFSGSVIIAEFDSLDQAQSWANDDPYLEAGVYQSVVVRPFKKVLP